MTLHTAYRDLPRSYAEGGLIGGPFGGFQVHTSPYIAPGRAVLSTADWFGEIAKNFANFGIEAPETPAEKARRAAEKKFRDLDVQVGDVVQLTCDGAVLQGTVVEAKE